VEFPVIRIMPPQNWELLDSALGKLFLVDSRNLPYYTWLIFTSANGVHIFCERLLGLGFDTQNLADVRVAAIGPATAAALARYGITADLVPGEYVAESVAAALIEDTQRRGESLEGKRILLPRAAEARQVLVTGLQQAGAIVDEVIAYTTLAAAADDEQGHEVLRLLQNGQIDIITFTSSSTVRNFMQWLTNCDAGLFKIACIGPITSRTARELGLKVDIEAREFTINGLVEAIVQSEGN
jgi:uroporphyrinogen-III synthase